jgi:class 3 adenylate cyclase
MNGDPRCREVNIVGDAVWSVINTPTKPDIDQVFYTACRAHSLVKALNCKLKAKGVDPIRVGIGMDWGRVLMIKAGYSGSGINDVVYMGDVVNSAAKLASKGDMRYLASGPLMAGSDFRFNLKPENQAFLQWNSSFGCYSGSAVNSVMEDWFKAHCA